MDFNGIIIWENFYSLVQSTIEQFSAFKTNYILKHFLSYQSTINIHLNK